MLRKTKGLRAACPIAQSLCNLVGSTPPPRKPPERFILSSDDGDRLRSYLIDWISTARANSPDKPFIVEIAQIAAEYKRVILTNWELKQLDRILEFTPRQKEALEQKGATIQ